MTTQRARLELGDYDRARDLLGVVAVRVRRLADAQSVTEREVDAARKRNAAAYDALHAALVVYRTLAAALVDGAGTDGRYDLDDAIVAADLLIADAPTVDTRPL